MTLSEEVKELLPLNCDRCEAAGVYCDRCEDKSLPDRIQKMEEDNDRLNECNVLAVLMAEKILDYWGDTPLDLQHSVVGVARAFLSVTRDSQ